MTGGLLAADQRRRSVVEEALSQGHKTAQAAAMRMTKRV